MTDAGGGERTVVVGAGIIGIACAHYLAKAGLPVTVIDRGTIAGACSHANCGFICPSHVLPLTEPGAIRTAIKSLLNPHAPFRIRPRLSPALWNWLWQFARRCNHRQMLEAGTHLKAILDSSLTEYRRLMEEEQFDCEWKQDGLLYVLRTERGMREFAETDRLLTENFGVTARRIDGPELPAFDPALLPGLAGGFHYAGDASVRPDLLNAQWAHRLRERGVRFVEHCELRGIEKSAGRKSRDGVPTNRIVRLATSQGTMAADRVVFAAGAWSARLSRELECHIPIQPGKGYSVTMARPEPCPRQPILFPEHRVGVSPFATGYRLGSIMEFAGYDASIPERRIRQLRESARHYLVAPFTEEIQERWYGWRPMTWDSLPIIGPVPRLENAYLATGHNMLGLSLAPATGRLIAELITSRSPHIDPGAFSPSRFGRT
jgi:D-amino-acid dehydrogenase